MGWKRKENEAPKESNDPFEKVERAMLRMQEPSWAILSALDPTHARPGIEILNRVEVMYRASGYPRRSLDASTLHYSLRRMQDDGLVKLDGEQEVEVPGPWETKSRQVRPVYKITGYGQMALARHARLFAQMHPTGIAVAGVPTTTDWRV